LFVAISRFVVANGMEEEVATAFTNRPRLVDDAHGFVRLSVLRPEGRPQEFWLMTEWTDRAAFEAWHRGHAYAESHQGIPRGLKLVQSETRITKFEVIAE